jgi:hypothetical protein
MRMRNRTLGLVLGVVVTGLAVAGDGTKQSWESMIAQLRETDTIYCSLIGYADTPSKEYGLYQAMVARGDRARFETLLKDAHPVIRCGGLLALAQKDGTKSVATLREYFSDRDIIGFLAYDIGSNMTVGNFAMSLLYDANHLDLSPLTPGHRHVSAPLLSGDELIGLAIEMLARDPPTDLHRTAVYQLTQGKKTGEFVLDLAALRQKAPSLKDYAIIKAIGRLEPSDDQRAFLVRCLHTPELEANARLAAACALTRKADEAAFEALRTERDTLDRLDGRRWGSRFIEMLNARRAFEARIEPFRGVGWREQEQMKDKIILAFASNQPLVADDLLNYPAPVVVREHDDVRKALADSFVAISGNLEDVSQPWNAYSNTGVKLDLLVRHIRFYPESERRWVERNTTGGQKPRQEQQLLTEEECRQIERNIAGFLKEPAKPGQP